MTYNPRVVDKTLVCLGNFIHERYPESPPLSAPLLAPRCGFELLFVVSDPPESTRPRFRLYPRVADVVQATRDRDANLAKGTKQLSSILPKKRRLQSVADEPKFGTPQVLNPDFSRLPENKTISNKRLSTVSFFELEGIEGCTKALLEANSFSLWLMSGLLSQLKRDGLTPSDPTLFDSAISSLSCSILNQTQTASALSDFVVSKRRESYLGHASLPLSTAQKRELLISPGFGSDLFDQELIEKVSGQVK